MKDFTEPMFHNKFRLTDTQEIAIQQVDRIHIGEARLERESNLSGRTGKGGRSNCCNTTELNSNFGPAPNERADCAAGR